MIIFEIRLKDYLKISTNKIYAGMHWKKRAKIKEDYLQWFQIYCSKIPICFRKVCLDFKFYFKGIGYDSSNCSYMCKMMEDCLVHFRILKDDTRKYVGKVSMESLKGKEDYCELTITTIEK